MILMGIVSGLDPLHGHRRVASGGLVKAGNRFHSQTVQEEHLSRDRVYKGGSGAPCTAEDDQTC